MRFSEALKLMKQGAKVKLPGWGGYWYWDTEKETIMIQCRPQDSDTQGDLLDIRQTQRVEYTIMNTQSDEWIVADGTNCPVLGGESTFSFSDAIRYLKRGLKVARKGWNGKGMYIFLITEDVATNSLGNALERKMNPYFVIKNVNESISTWVPSINDCLAEDWMFAE